MFNKNNETTSTVNENTEIAAVAAEVTEAKEEKKPMGQKLKEFGGKALGVAKKVLPLVGAAAAGVVGTLVVTKMSQGCDDDEYDEEYEDEDDSSDEE